MNYAMLNDDIIDSASASISISDRGFILGDGVFETMRSYKGHVFRLSQHIQRLFNSCKVFNINIGQNENEISDRVYKLIKKNELTEARIRLTVTRGEHNGSMALPTQNTPTILITAAGLPKTFLEEENKSVSVMTADIRFSKSNPTFKHKTLNRLPHMMARTQAEQNGADEALILEEKGNVVTCSTGNIFVVHGGQLFTPPLNGPVLPGITRDLVLELAFEAGVPVRQNYFTPMMIKGADEAFMTNSVQEVLPISYVDGNQIGSGKKGPITSNLYKLYQDKI
jgi:branched-chain amino acid aminotransferase